MWLDFKWFAWIRSDLMNMLVLLWVLSCYLWAVVKSMVVHVYTLWETIGAMHENTNYWQCFVFCLFVCFLLLPLAYYAIITFPVVCQTWSWIFTLINWRVGLYVSLHRLFLKTTLILISLVSWKYFSLLPKTVGHNVFGCCEMIAMDI